MDFLKDYIGLRGSGITPDSGLYVNSLPGISLKAIDQMANQEQVTYAQVWDDVQQRSIKGFGTKLTSKFSERFRLKKISKSIDLGKLIDTVNNQTAPDSEYRGFTFELKWKSDVFFKPSGLQVVWVKELNYFAAAAGAVTLKIFDLDLNTEVYSKTVTMAQGWNRIPVFQCFDAYRLFFCYDSTSTTSVYQALNYWPQELSNEVVHTIYQWYGFEVNGWLRGCKSDIVSPLNFTAAPIVQNNNTYGLSAIFSLLCGFENIVKNNLKAFELAFWYQLGIELMVECLASSRYNIVTIDKAKAEELLKYFTDKFEEELTLTVRGIDLDMKDACIDCNAPSRYVQSYM